MITTLVVNVKSIAILKKSYKISLNLSQQKEQRKAQRKVSQKEIVHVLFGIKKEVAKKRESFKIEKR